MRRSLLLAGLTIVLGQASAQAATLTSSALIPVAGQSITIGGDGTSINATPVTVYDTATPAPAAGYGEPTSGAPIYGDALNLAQAGMLNVVGFDIYNSNSGGTNTGQIISGTMNIRIYDNTVPYSGAGSLASADPLLANVNVNLSFSGAGLPVGSFSRITSDFTSLNLTLPQNIVITQQFTQTAGTSTQNGTVISATNSATGSSPAAVYINSANTPEGYYNFGASSTSQFAYSISVTPVPEPTSMACFGIAMLGVGALRRRRIG